MSENPYEAPQAEIVYQSNPADTAEFYVVSKKKMILLFVATLGIYQVFWFYQNWRLHKLASGGNIWPLPRAIFSIFFVHSLFRAVNARLESGSVGSTPWNHSQQATIIVLLLIASHILDRMASKLIGSPITDGLSLLLLWPLATCFASAQVRINEACGDPLGESNSKLTVANYVWIVLGVVFWALIGIGLFLPAEQI